jgi:hypothetical protein
VNQVQRAVRTRQRRFGVLCVLGYVALAWAVRLDVGRGEDFSLQNASLVYPLDTFSMYSDVPGGRMSYLLVRDAEGGLHQVTDFHSFDCAEPVAGSAARCAQGSPIHYLHDDFTHYIRSHQGPGTTEVELVLRSWRLEAGAAAVQEADCVVSRCRVSR